MMFRLYPYERPLTAQPRQLLGGNGDGGIRARKRQDNEHEG